MAGANRRTPVGIIGGTGYVSGELLRLLASHPTLTLGGIASISRAGTALGEVFPNLSGCLGDSAFSSLDTLQTRWRNGELAGVFCATPHGAAAPVIESLLDGYEGPGRVVDISADFRFRDVDLFRDVYGQDHGAPHLAGEFTCAVPEHLDHIGTRHAAHPGCFATAMLLGIVPLVRSGLTETEFFVSGVTGSTGSGRSPLATTHHPERHSNLYAYRPLAHRHVPEIESITRAMTGDEAKVHFVPHSGPFARGIHVTIQGRLRTDADPAALTQALRRAYRGHRFVEVSDSPPRIKDVTSSNRARLALACSGNTYAVMVVIDNLVKGAAGGAMQWMNRLLDIDEHEGLTSPGPAWI